eukprot:329333_1
MAKEREKLLGSANSAITCDLRSFDWVLMLQVILFFLVICSFRWLWVTGPTKPNELPLLQAFSDIHLEETIGNWRQGDLIGTGASARVYLGLKDDNGQLMAVKQIPLDKLDDGMAQHLESEVNILRSLKHPMVVQYFGAHRTKEHLNVFLEFVSGGSIASLLEEFGAFDEGVRRNYTRQIVTGVTFLHSRAVVHGGIKGTNVLVTTGGRYKLNDFGASRKLTYRTDSTRIFAIWAAMSFRC